MMQTRIMAHLLNAVERDAAASQRRLTSELDIALGLVNAYLKRCIKIGLVKVRHAPARRYAYYLTPKGLAEKSRLTSYLQNSPDMTGSRLQSTPTAAYWPGKDHIISRIS
jgi:DNA-binding MarR family transcriptional regulator